MMGGLRSFYFPALHLAQKTYTFPEAGFSVILVNENLANDKNVCKTGVITLWKVERIS